MKAMFVGSKYDGCYYVRCLLPLIHNGWDGAKTSLEGETIDNEEMFRLAMASDIVVFQRPDTPDKTEAIRLLKKAGKKIVFDNDDTYRPDSQFPKLSDAENQLGIEKINNEIYKNVSQADLVTTTTKVLADEYRALNDNVVVLPNCVDPFDWDEPLKNDNDKIRIGVTGSVVFDDYNVIRNYLAELSKDDRVELVFFGMRRVKKKDTDSTFERAYKEMYNESFEFIDSLRAEWHQSVPMSQYFAKLNDLRLDIMFMPRRETYFNKCKSNLKFLESSMLEIPVVASSFSDNLSPYDSDIIDGINGYLAKTEQEFRDKTEILIRDKDLRVKVGKSAKTYTLANYNIENKHHLWADEFSKLIK